MELNAVLYCYSEPIRSSQSGDHAEPSPQETVGFRIVKETLSMPDRDTFTTKRIMPAALAALLGALAVCRRRSEKEGVPR
jgi:MYXO-CTERM domain-containing protein